ncbi:MAG: F510_1955 family glycosylhydrolase [Gaiellaceae bacterium]
MVLAAAALTRGDSDDGGGAVPNLLESTDPGPIHVHGLGINLADGALFIATHMGTYRVAPGEQEAARAGNSRQDTMGFSVVGPNRFLGSGHPDPVAMREQGLPPNLGLIESTDGGRTWRSVSLLGDADFHILRSHGRRVYGFDSANGRLLASDDGGTTWRQRPIPGPLIDLAAHPQRPSHLVAVTERGLIASTDAGRSWRALGGGIGLLAWPAADRLLLVDGAGGVHVSENQGKRWRPKGDIGGQPAAFLAQTTIELYVALHDGTVKRSADGGESWEIRSAP